MPNGALTITNKVIDSDYTDYAKKVYKALPQLKYLCHVTFCVTMTESGIS